MKRLRRGTLWVLGAAVACGGGGSGPGPSPSNVLVSAGDNQIGSAGQPLGAALEVTVQDASGNPLAGVSVHWAAASGGGSVAPATSTTDAGGKATTIRTLGPSAGAQTTTAAAGSVTPATFHHIAQIQGATQIAANSVLTQTDTVLTTKSFSVIVKDQNNQPVTGVTVNWSVTGGSDVFSQAATPTGADGVASTDLTLTQTAGPRSVQAAVTGLQGSPVQFIVNATAGHATSLSAVAGATSGTPGAVVTLNALAKDAYGNPSQGDTVVWHVTFGGGAVNPDTSLTGPAGTASTQHTLGAAVGDDSVIAAAFGDTVKYGLTIASAPAADTVTVGPNIVFSPSQINIASGGTAVFIWAQGSITHGVEWLTGPQGATLPANSANMTTGKYEVILTTPGTYTYDCTVHGAAMSGTVVVH